MKQLLAYVDLCIGNEEDAQMALGYQMSNNIEKAELYDKEYETIARSISREYGCKYVAFTLRESFSASHNGWSALLYSDGKAFKSRHYDILLVDRVGGGDSFAAGLIYGLLKKMDAQKAIEFAVAASCLKQTIEGDFNRCSENDILELINNNGSGRVQR